MRMSHCHCKRCGKFLGYRSYSSYCDDCKRILWQFIGRTWREH